MKEDNKNEIDELLVEQKTNIFKEFRDFLVMNKAYWLAPIFIVMILLIGLVVLSSVTGGAAAPFIYTLF